MVFLVSVFNVMLNQNNDVDYSFNSIKEKYYDLRWVPCLNMVMNCMQFCEIKTNKYNIFLQKRLKWISSLWKYLFSKWKAMTQLVVTFIAIICRCYYKIFILFNIYILKTFLFFMLIPLKISYLYTKCWTNTIQNDLERIFLCIL